MSILEANGLTKIFGETRAVDGVSFTLDKGEILTLVGPSGCGKTTTLRLIAGLEEPDDGRIAYRGETIVSVADGVFVPTHRRGMGMVFQSYAIWPHMTVGENVSYPLKLRKITGGEAGERVRRALDLVGLGGYQDRPAPMLSGGQQQRVALARALIYEPDLLLLDEPFSNLDAKLKEQMRVELKLLQRKLSVAAVFVTHDQIEALTMSDRIAVMNAGRIEHLGTPEEVYRAPRTPFVLDFLGKTTVLTGRLGAPHGDGVEVMINGAAKAVLAAAPSADIGAPGDDVRLAVRPEDIAVLAGGGDAPGGKNALPGTVRSIMFMGNRYEIAVELSGGALVSCYAAEREMQGLTEGGAAMLSFAPAAASLWRR